MDIKKTQQSPDAVPLPSKPNSLERYQQELGAFDLNTVDKRALLEAVQLIALSFVDLAFEGSEDIRACGKHSETGPLRTNQRSPCGRITHPKLERSPAPHDDHPPRDKQ